MKRSRRAIAVVTIAAVLGVVGAGAANASYFSWYMSRVLVGFNSRTYATPTQGGHAIESDTCSWTYPAPGSKYRLQLTQETPWYEPDRNAGQSDYPCPGGYSYHSFGTQPGGSYHFTVVAADNTYGLDATGYTYYP